MERSTRKIALVGIVLLVVGLIAWIVQLTGGLLAGSNMTNVFLWGLMIAVFAFLVGFGAGSQFVASAIILSGKEELKLLARIAGACGLACVCAAGVAILADLGAIRNALAMIVGMNPRSPLAWDMIAMCTFIVLSIVRVTVFPALENMVSFLPLSVDPGVYSAIYLVLIIAGVCIGMLGSAIAMRRYLKV